MDDKEIINIIPSKDISFKTRSLLSQILSRLELTNQDRLDLEKYITFGGGENLDYIKDNLKNIEYIKDNFEDFIKWKDKILNIIKDAPEEFDTLIEIFNHIEQHIKESNIRFEEIDKIKFTNPVGPHCPDPCFWKADDGYFYVKGTGRIETVLRTRNFVDYEDTGRTFLSESALQWLNDNYGHPYNNGSILVPHCWAPFVIKIGNNWILYMSVVERESSENEQSIIIDGAAHIVAFTSKTPYGNFTNPVTIVSDGDFKLTNSVIWNNVIDPFVYHNPEDQKIYLVAGSSYSIGRLELTNDGLATVLEKNVGNKCVRMAGLTISSDSTREQVYEGAYIYAKPYNGKTYYYLFASKGHYAEDNYGLIVGRCTNLNAEAGNISDGWIDKFNTPLITKVTNTHASNRVILSGYSKNSGKPWGPGHCAGIFETTDGKTWMLYHCHTGNGTNDRELFIQEVLWDDEGWPYFEGGNIIESGQISKHIITDTPKIQNNTLEIRIKELENIISQITERE